MREIKKWEPENFELELNTVWSFPDRGDWATHDGKYRGNWSPYIPHNILLRFSQEGDTIIDQFAGGGTTFVEAKLLNRNIVGVDVNDDVLRRCAEKCDFEYESAGKVRIEKGDARNLSFVPDGSIDLVCTHPLYANIISYSEDLANDLFHFAVKDFLDEMKADAAGFKTKEIIIKEQHNCATAGYWKSQSIKYNFLLLAHEYLFIFRK
jgi:DNA modification methylase